MSRLRKQQTDETFTLEPGHVLVRRVTLDDGSSSAHRCPLDSFKQIVHAIEESGEAGATVMEMAEKEDLPSSQVAVARAFLWERSIIEVGPRRRMRAASPTMVEDALTEFHALANSRA